MKTLTKIKIAMKKQIINETGYKQIYCPLCQDQVAKPSAKIAAWISPTGVEVCWYTICANCIDQFMGLSQAEQSRHSDMIEYNLLVKYPRLQAKLPPGYSPAVEPSPKDNVSVPMRLFTRTELEADQEFVQAWATSDAQALDRALMLRYSDLTDWVRELVPRELEKERENMLIQNLTKKGITETADYFDQIYKDANCRWIRVISHAHGIRSKLPVHADFVQGQQQVQIVATYADITAAVDHWEELQSIVRKLDERAKEGDDEPDDADEDKD